MAKATATAKRPDAGRTSKNGAAHHRKKPHARNFIDGIWVDSPRRGTSTAPADGAVLGSYADGDAETAAAAIEAARRAFAGTAWAHDRQLRARALFEMADRLEAAREELITLLARENGKILADAAFEIDLSIPKLRYYGALALSDYGQSAEVGPGMYSMTLRQPIGVAAVIAPWNSPVVLAIRSFAPALAAGCTVAMKLPGQTALTNGLFYEIIAGTPSLPPGVMNMFTESGNDGAPLMISHPDTAVISYTGSTKVGRAIMASAAPLLKPMSLELGGKTPMIVFDDADLDAAVPVLVKAITTFNGQFCMTGSRILAQRPIADELRRRLITALTTLRIGPGDDPDSEIGPMIDAANAERVDEFVSATKEYAKIVVRGGRPAEPELAAGAYYRPSLVEVVDLDTPIVQQEVFGPVATFEIFDSETDAVRRANATEYGLAASLWTRDVDLPLRVGRQLDAGTVWTNTWAVVNDQFPEGGFKQSGIGRLNGTRALEEFMELKHFVHPVPPSNRPQ
ncbi:aldehyde dehydrogenase family protein [Nocardia sp. 2]|uniref:Aldehyde dehydrogenase family protein n=1 Tax=Nocardia acididurans TaxID=2802282 RepID=A0ABS1MIQ0_9NOCA|nr:aldehyde dehydrogenase family protein [Nocardia acididurans]MBL1079935.1 aldehyde dehydrogenase family protein [Nocardia acididurans]